MKNFIHHFQNRTGNAIQQICKIIIPSSHQDFYMVFETFLEVLGALFPSEMRNTTNFRFLDSMFPKRKTVKDCMFMIKQILNFIPSMTGKNH